MAIYHYRYIAKSDEVILQIEQPVGDPPLKKHPLNGALIERIYEPPNVSTSYTDNHKKKQLEPKRLESKGFSYYKRDDSGHYYKIAGPEEAPD